MLSKLNIDESVTFSSTEEDSHPSKETLDRDLDKNQDPVILNDLVSDQLNLICSSSSTSSSVSMALPTLHPLHTLRPSPPQSPLSSRSSPTHSSPSPTPSSPSPTPSSPSPTPSSPSPTHSSPSTTPSSPLLLPLEHTVVPKEVEHKRDSMNIGLRDSVLLSSDTDTTKINREIDCSKELRNSFSFPISSPTLPLFSLPLLSLPPPSLSSHLPLSTTTTTSVPNSYQTKSSLSPFTILHKSTDLSLLQ